MRTRTGVLGMCLMALGALVVSSTKTKTAEAHSGSVEPLVAVQAQPPTASVASAPVILAALASSAAPVSAPVILAALASSAAPVSAPVEIITPPPADLNLENPKLRRMQAQEITKDMLEVAAKIVRRHYAKPVGTQIEVELNGKHLVARIERHFHPEGGPVKPWGYHPGVSLFALR